MEENKKIFVLHGYWNEPCGEDGDIVIASYDRKILEEKLEDIIENKGLPGVFRLTGRIESEEISMFGYEAMNCDCNFVKFYISETEVLMR